MKKIFFALSLLVFSVSMVSSQATIKYYKVKFDPSPGLFTKMMDLDIYVDHYHTDDDHGIELVLNEFEMANLTNSDIPHEILVEDLSEVIEERNIRDMALYRQSQNARSAPDGFDFGTMGGFYTFDEVVVKLDEMTTNYPSLASNKFSIGQTVEGREIWAIKISDNPNTDESNTETAVHYDALHHCREPLSMAVTINYMFWLLENYGSDDEVTYLVDSKEMYFIPVVNADGYVHNQNTNPNGGGLWRKNRRTFPGQGCPTTFGVDLNRNYSFGWGLNSGSSPNCNSNTYRGPSPFSEPETQAIRDFVLDKNPPAAFTSHSTAGSVLQAFGFTPDPVDYENYAEFSLDLYQENEYPYGVTGNMLGYTSSGTTRDWLYGDRGAYAWTPEIDGSGFWPAMSEIMPLVAENIYPMKKLAWISGAYPNIKHAYLIDDPSLLPGNTENLNVEIFNKGLREATSNLVLKLNVISGNANVVNNEIAVDPIAERTIGDISSTPFEIAINANANPGEELVLELIVEMEGVVVHSEFLKYFIGTKTTLFHDNAENGLDNFVNSGNGLNWDTSFVDSRSGLKCIADSRYGNSSNNTNNRIALANNISLVGTEKPILSYHAKWALEAGFDYVRVQLSTNNGGTWQTLAGEQTNTILGSPGYSENQTWVQEIIDLSPFIGEEVRIRFTLFTDSGIPADGFHFDDLNISDYALSVNIPGCTNMDAHNYNPNATSDDGSCETCDDGIQNGDETAIDCGGALCASCCTVEIANLIIENADCGEPSGQVEIIAVNGTAPYQYSLDGITYQNENLFDNLIPNDYIAYVKDANDCVLTESFRIFQGISLTFDVASTNTNCGMEDGSISITVFTGLPPYQYSIDGINYQPENEFLNLNADTYTVSVIDGQQCERLEVVTVGSSGVATIDVNETPASCGSANGTIVVIASNGIAPYTYSLNDGPFQSESVFENVTAGAYQLKVRDANQCLNTYNGQLNDLGNAALDAMVRSTSCAMQNGSITLNATAGLAPFLYSLDGLNFVDDNLFENLPAATYQGYVKDANDCIAFLSELVIADSQPFSINADINHIKCNGANDGSLIIGFNNGTPPYFTSLDGSDFEERTNYDNLGPINHSLIVRDSKGCEFNLRFDIVEPDAIVITFDLEDDKLNANVTGGTGDYSYSWNDGSMESFIANPTDTTYAVTVTDENQCSEMASFQVIGTSIDPNYLNQSVKTYPNPTDEALFVEIEDATWFDLMEIYNMNGQQVFSLPVNSNKINVSTAHFSSGTYVIQFKGKEALSRKLIIY